MVAVGEMFLLLLKIYLNNPYGNGEPIIYFFIKIKYKYSLW